jgi:hypothetical protein
MRKSDFGSPSTALLENLNPVTSARFDSDGAPNGCLSETRVKLLSNVMTWFQEDKRSVYWLRGLAGTGKSSVARSVADLADAQGLLAGTFFFSRTDIKRQRASAVIPTLAYQLAKWRPELCQRICDALRSKTDIASCNVQKQVQHIFTDNLKAVPVPMPRGLIVLDALDECEMVDGCEGGALLPLLIACLGGLAFTLKIFITSRDERSISTMFAKLQTCHPAKTLTLHVDIEDALIDADIAHYLTHEFKDISKKSESGVWWTPQQIKELVSRTQRLFVYAATVVRYISGGIMSDSPADLLGNVLSDTQTSNEAQHRFLDGMYLQVLRKAASNPDADQALLRQRLQVLAGTLILLQQPMERRAIARLVKLPVPLMSALNSLLLESTTDQTVRVFHPSFEDFIVNPARCRDSAFRVSPADHHRRLATRCLFVMNQLLQQDICKIRRPWLPNTQATERLDVCIPAELRYACSFWDVHLPKSGVPDTELMNVLKVFCRQHLLHWIESLSLLNELGRVHEYLPGALAWCQVCISSVNPTMMCSHFIRNTWPTMKALAVSSSCWMIAGDFCKCIGSPLAPMHFRFIIVL